MDETAFTAAIIAHSDDAIIGKDLNGNILSWNPGAERIYGYSAQEMLGQNIEKIVPADGLAEFRVVMSRVEKGLGFERLITRRKRKDGSMADVAVTISPVRDGYGKLVGASTIARDVTRSMHLQRQLEETLDKLKQVNDVLIDAEAENIRLRRQQNAEPTNNGGANSALTVGTLVSAGLVGLLAAWLVGFRD